jgi:hypothetical protein
MIRPVAEREASVADVSEFLPPKTIGTWSRGFCPVF